MDEYWGKISGFEDYYEVSNIGNVRNIKYGSYILKPHDNGTGYLMLCLCVNDIRTYKTIHQLVANTFLGPTPEGKEINHKDGNKLNNRLENLEYITRSENIRHAFKLGLITRLKGEQRTNAKLTDEGVRDIKKRLKVGDKITAIARDHNIPYQRVQLIRDGIAWPHITID